MKKGAHHPFGVHRFSSLERDRDLAATLLPPPPPSQAPSVRARMCRCTDVKFCENDFFPPWSVVCIGTVYADVFIFVFRETNFCANPFRPFLVCESIRVHLAL